MQLIARCRRNKDTENKENLQSNRQNAVICSSQKENHQLMTVINSNTSPQLLKLGNRSVDSSPELAILPPDNPDCQTSITSAFLDTYYTQIQAEGLKQQPLGPCLENHHIDVSLRGRMVDWMIEVTASYLFEPKTYFDGVLYLDKYLKAKPQALQPTEIHSLGVAAMLLSSKQNQVYSLSVPTAFDRIAHRKIPISKLQNTEADIMKHLDYKLNEWSFYDIAVTLLASFDNNLLIPVLTYICRLIVIEYTLYSSLKPALLGAAAASVAAQICKVRNSKKLMQSDHVEKFSRKILGLVSGFRSVYPSLRNPDKFTEIEVIRTIYRYIEEHENDLI